MDKNKVYREWNGPLKRSLNEIYRRKNLMEINFDFNLGKEFQLEDLDPFLKEVNIAINSVKTIRQELQR